MITHVEIKNYKSIGDVSLDLEPLTVLVGENGSGKSNFVDALRFVVQALSSGLEAAVRERNGIEALRRQVPASAEQVAVRLETESSGVTGEYGFKLACLVSGACEVVDERARLETDGWVEEINRDPQRVVLANCQDGRLLGEPVSVELPVSRHALVLAALRGRRVTKLWNAIVGMCFYSTFPGTLRDPQKRGRDDRLGEQGENLASVLESMDTKSSQWLPDLRSALGHIVPGVRDLRVTAAGTTYRVIQLEHVQDGGDPLWLDLAQESDGTIRVLALLTALYQDPPPTLIAIEEPELYVHPGAMGVLCDEIRAASHRSQVLITTHSPDILDRFKPEEIRVVEKRGGVTEIGPVSDGQVEAIREMLLAPGELMQAEGLRMQRGGD